MRFNLLLGGRATGPLERKMKDLDKRKVYALIQKSLQEFSNEKFQIVSFAPYYVIDGTSGVKFTVKKGDVELNFFAGFSSDKKYSEKLLFGILKSESNEKIEKLNLNKDENGNNIQEKLSIDEKFLSADEDSQKQKLTKWLSKQILTVFSLYGMFNFSYANIGFVRWFVFIELPWIILLATSAYVCLLENIKDDVTYFPLSCKILCSISFLLFDDRVLVSFRKPISFDTPMLVFSLNNLFLHKLVVTLLLLKNIFQSIRIRISYSGSNHGNKFSLHGFVQVYLLLIFFHHLHYELCRDE